MTLPPIIGLNGVARAGKDTVAQILHDLYGYEVVSFSKILNDVLVALNPHVYFPDSGMYPRYATIIEHEGYEKAKEIPEVRRLLQAMGTEVGRTYFGENVWVDALFRSLPKGKLVTITNVRFPNEAQAVWLRDGVVWEVTRPGFYPANGHVSDTALDGIVKDAHIVNDSSIPALADKVMDLLAGSPMQTTHNDGVRASG